MKKSEAEALRKILLEAAERFTDAEITERLILLDPWKKGTEYKAGARIKYRGSAWKCKADHASEAIPENGTLWSLIEKEAG